MHLQRRFILALLFAVHAGSFAENTLILSLINDSSHTFDFEKTSVEFKGNVVSIDTDSLEPGQTATVTGNTTSSSDLSAIISFKNGAQLWIIDKLQCHVGPPLFDFLFKHTSGDLAEKTPNPLLGARLLSYVAAKIVISDLTADPI